MTAAPIPHPAVAWANREWRADIVDPPPWRGRDRGLPPPASWLKMYADDRDAIRSYARTVGWLDKAKTYECDGDASWCGWFAGSAWVAAGLKLAVARSFFASTARLQSWARGEAFNGVRPPKTSASRVVQFGFVQPGDIVVVGHVKPYGDHIAVVERIGDTADDYGAVTISGNGHGLGPSGERREGVSRRTYPVSSWTRVYRPAPEDLNQ